MNQVKSIKRLIIATVRLNGGDCSPNSTICFTYTPSIPSKILDVRVIDNSNQVDIDYCQLGNQIISAFSKRGNRFLPVAVSLSIFCFNHDKLRSHFCEVEIDLEEIL